MSKVLSTRWRIYFMRLARENARMSKDPSTQVGAVIARPNKTVACMGFNGFPINMRDEQVWLETREEKYSRIIHAEMNALQFAQERLDNCIMFVWPCPPCDRCAPHIAQAGIRTIYAPAPSPDYLSRWQDSYDKAMRTFESCAVTVLLTLDDLDG